MTVGDERLLPLMIFRPIMLARNHVDRLGSARVGEVVTFMDRFDDPKPLPDGWLDPDGSPHARKEYPELALICRQYTGWLRWNVLRQFRVPDFHDRIMAVMDRKETTTYDSTPDTD